MEGNAQLRGAIPFAARGPCYTRRMPLFATAAIAPDVARQGNDENRRRLAKS